MDQLDPRLSWFNEAFLSIMDPDLQQTIFDLVLSAAFDGHLDSGNVLASAGGYDVVSISRPGSRRSFPRRRGVSPRRSATQSGGPLPSKASVRRRQAADADQPKSSDENLPVEIKTRAAELASLIRECASTIATMKQSISLLKATGSNADCDGR